MKRTTTARPLTPAEERRLFTAGTAQPPPEEEETPVKRWAGKKGGTVGEREAQQRLLREEGVRDQG